MTASQGAHPIAKASTDEPLMVVTFRDDVDAETRLNVTGAIYESARGHVQIDSLSHSMNKDDPVQFYGKLF